ncbi:hypothetical protein COO60DRAFT_649132 [Scenedesmus sp. NREL 46B-D3]|nr:hypothetical protein COO60DRAFT_649132 [Scenedesmus sp. NREL 46B-D3]
MQLLDDDDEDEDEDEVGVEEVASLMQELAEGLGDEEQQQQQGPEAAAAAAWRACYISRQVPAPQLGPVALKLVPGKGRGVFTTAAVAAGDLLLVAQPLALLYCEEGTTPENEELADTLTAAVVATAAAAEAPSSSSSSSSSSGGLELWQQHALLQLRAAGEGQDGTAAEQHQQLLQQLLGDPSVVAAELRTAQASSSSSSSSAEASKQQPQELAPLPPAPGALPSADKLLQVVHANCTGEEFEDAALTLLRGSTSCGHLGIWPAAAMINHACCPNAHAMLLGDRLVVRAAEDVPAGQQVSVSYLGPQLFAPAAVRQQELRQQWGFECGCARCKAEARYAGSSVSGSGEESATLSRLLGDTYAACQGMAEQLDAAVEAGDVEAVAAMQQQLQQMQQQVEAGIRAAKPPANVRRWLQASVYDLYDLLSLCADQLPAAPPKAANSGRRGPGKKQGAAAAPAIETEADLTTEYMVRAEARFGDGHQEAADALRMCSTAHVARYGPISKGLLQLLMDTRAGAALL